VALHASPSSSSGSGVQAYANFAALPAGQPDGTVAVTLDTNSIYVYDAGTLTWVLSSGASSPDTYAYTYFGGL